VTSKYKKKKYTFLSNFKKSFLRIIEEKKMFRKLDFLALEYKIHTYVVNAVVNSFQ